MSTITKVQKDAIKALKKFNNWHSSGGEKRAGLPSNSLGQLNSNIKNCRHDLLDLSQSLEKVTDNWARIQSNNDNESVRQIVSEIIEKLEKLDEGTSDLIRRASRVETQIHKATSLVEGRMVEDGRSIIQINKNIIQSKAREDAATRRMRAAQNELKGSKGFGNGFLTGLTLGLHNPLKDNLNKARTESTIAHTQVVHQHKLKNKKERSIEELNEGSNLISKMKKIESVITDYQNLLNNVSREINEAQKDEENSFESENRIVWKLYQKRANKDMRELSDLKDILQDSI